MKRFRKKISPTASRILFGVFFFFILTEVSLRLSGIGQFPVYQTDLEIGYLPAPSQSGQFLNRNDWSYNALSMGVGEPFASKDRNNLLLLGDSLVQGGNPYRQKDKLGPQLQEQLKEKWHVWPVGAASWGFLNQREYLRRHPEVLASIQGIVWVFNSGDFQDRSQWWSDATHPRHRPWILSHYVFNKYLLEGNLQFRFPQLLFWVKGPPPVSTKPPDAQWNHWVETCLQLRSYRLSTQVVLLYPDQNEKLNPSAEDFYQTLADRMQSLLKKEGWKYIDLRQQPLWKIDYYRDFIHPTVEGNQTLAQIIAKSLEP